MKRFLIKLRAVTAFGFLLLFAVEPAFAQVEEISLEEALEAVGMDGMEEGGVEFLAEELAGLQDNPIDINTASDEELRQLGFLSEWQAAAILNYRESYGEILSWEELFKYIPAIDAKTGALLQRFCVLGGERCAGGAAARAPKTKHQFLARYGRTLAKSEGYLKGKYPGSPDQLLFKYTLNRNNKITAGFAAQQDAGEPFTRQGFDAYAGYITIKDIGFIKNLTAGHYRIQWGYGLNASASGGFFSGADADLLQSTGAGIKGYASGAEAGFLQGLAGSFRLGRGWTAEAFYSNRRIDGKADLSSLSQTGYHRTESEIAKKEKVRYQLTGFKTEKGFKNFRIGLIATYYQYGGLYNPDPERGSPLNPARAAGSNISLYYQYLLNKFHFYGEYAYNPPHAYALLQGFQWKPAETLALSAVYRRFSRDYYSSYADVPNSKPPLEPNQSIDGKRKDLLEWQLRSRFAPKFTLDIKGSFLAERTYPDLPFYGYKFQAKLLYETKRFTPTLLIAYNKSRTREGLSLQAKLKWNTAAGLNGESRMESFNLAKGLLLMQDAGYTHSSGRFAIRLRAAVFQTRDYAHRIYAYEPDVLYAASAPAFYGKGCRLALILKTEPLRGLHLELKYAHTLYDGTQTTGSGDTRINTWLKPEIKLQLRYNLTVRPHKASRKKNLQV